MALSQRTSSRPVLGATRARQGRPGRPILWVLTVGIALTVIAFVIAYAFRADDFASTAPNNAREPADAQMFNAPEPAPLAQPPAEAPPPPVG